MKYVQASKPYVQHFDFEVDGQLVTPESANYSVRGNDQGIVGGLDEVDITITSGMTSVNIPIDGAINGISQDYTLRYVDLQFVYQGITFQLGDFYNVRDTLNVPVKPDDVRAMFSANSTEMPDSSIDIYQAYALVQADVSVGLDDIITGGSNLLPYLIEAVKCRAAMICGISISNAMMQSEQADNTLYKRFASIDYQSMLNTFSGRYAAALRVLTGADSNGISPVLGIMTADTDYITGQ